MWTTIWLQKNLLKRSVKIFWTSVCLKDSGPAPGPLSPPLGNLPRRKTTARSYSCTTFRSGWLTNNYIHHKPLCPQFDIHSQADLETEAKRDGEGDEDEEDGGDGQEDGAEAKAMAATWVGWGFGWWGRARAVWGWIIFGWNYSSLPMLQQRLTGVKVEEVDFSLDRETRFPTF